MLAEVNPVTTPLAMYVHCAWDRGDIAAAILIPCKVTALLSCVALPAVPVWYDQLVNLGASYQATNNYLTTGTVTFV